MSIAKATNHSNRHTDSSEITTPSLSPKIPSILSDSPREEKLAREEAIDNFCKQMAIETGCTEVVARKVLDTCFMNEANRALAKKQNGKGVGEKIKGFIGRAAFTAGISALTGGFGAIGVAAYRTADTLKQQIKEIERAQDKFASGKISDEIFQAFKGVEGMREIETPAEGVAHGVEKLNTIAMTRQEKVENKSWFQKGFDKVTQKVGKVVGSNILQTPMATSALAMMAARTVRGLGGNSVLTGVAVGLGLGVQKIMGMDQEKAVEKLKERIKVCQNDEGAMTRQDLELFSLAIQSDSLANNVATGNLVRQANALLRIQFKKPGLVDELTSNLSKGAKHSDFIAHAKNMMEEIHEARGGIKALLNPQTKLQTMISKMTFGAVGGMVAGLVSEVWHGSSSGQQSTPSNLAQSQQGNNMATAYDGESMSGGGTYTSAHGGVNTSPSTWATIRTEVDMGKWEAGQGYDATTQTYHIGAIKGEVNWRSAQSLENGFSKDWSDSDTLPNGEPNTAAMEQRAMAELIANKIMIEHKGTISEKDLNTLVNGVIAAHNGTSNEYSEGLAYMEKSLYSTAHGGLYADKTGNWLEDRYIQEAQIDDITLPEIMESWINTLNPADQALVNNHISGLDESGQKDFAKDFESWTSQQKTDWLDSLRPHGWGTGNEGASSTEGGMDFGTILGIIGATVVGAGGIYGIYRLKRKGGDLQKKARDLKKKSDAINKDPKSTDEEKKAAQEAAEMAAAAAIAAAALKEKEKQEKAQKREEEKKKKEEAKKKKEESKTPEEISEKEKELWERISTMKVQLEGLKEKISQIADPEIRKRLTGNRFVDIFKKVNMAECNAQIKIAEENLNGAKGKMSTLHSVEKKLNKIPLTELARKVDEALAGKQDDSQEEKEQTPDQLRAEIQKILAQVKKARIDLITELEQHQDIKKSDVGIGILQGIEISQRETPIIEKGLESKNLIVLESKLVAAKAEIRRIQELQSSLDEELSESSESDDSVEDIRDEIKQAKGSFDRFLAIADRMVEGLQEPDKTTYELALAKHEMNVDSVIRYTGSDLQNLKENLGAINTAIAAVNEIVGQIQTESTEVNTVGAENAESQEKEAVLTSLKIKEKEYLGLTQKLEGLVKKMENGDPKTSYTKSLSSMTSTYFRVVAWRDVTDKMNVESSLLTLKRISEQFDSAIKECKKYEKDIEEGLLRQDIRDIRSVGSDIEDALKTAQEVVTSLSEGVRKEKVVVGFIESLERLNVNVKKHKEYAGGSQAQNETALKQAQSDLQEVELIIKKLREWKNPSQELRTQ